MRRPGLPRALGRCLGAVAAALALAAAPARADYPDRPIHLVVPFPAGGGADVLARTIMPRVARELGTTIVIENRPGAGGNVGAEHVARAAPDGYTLLYGTNGTHAINRALYASIPFDPVRDFAPVSRMTQIAALVVVYPGLPVATVAELVAYARANPGRVFFASAGNGTTSHLAGEMFKTVAQVDLVHTPYRGGALAANDLMGGHVAMMIDVMPNVLPLAKGGKLRALAVTTAARVPAAPDIPTVAESGLPGFEVSAWDGILAPAGTPPAAIDRLNAAIRVALADPEVRDALVARGAQPVPGTPDAFARHIAAESDKWAQVVKKAGAKID
ncbi:MAG: tripartite tricarboxylate transporter substrate binding protein [Burkholderiales bacterium]|jgi:tripartite-type tricarboxylate transporter receptor subunit TctC|nr:tripartite tricarboxylate transporter substrate binding protein [Burkholderiales bacterium]